MKDCVRVSDFVFLNLCSCVHLYVVKQGEERGQQYISCDQTSTMLKQHWLYAL